MDTGLCDNFQNSSRYEIDNHMFHMFIPSIITVGMYIFIGILGNSCVICVYLHKMGKTTDNRFFIPCLAAGDMLACVVCGISDILMHVFLTNFSNDLACKFIWFSMTWSASGAAMILVFIAFQRYMKICRPLRQSNLMKRRFPIILSFYILTVVLSSPILFTAGSTRLDVCLNNISIQICERIGRNQRSDWKLYIALIHTGIEAFIVVSIAVTLSTLYMKVGIQLLRQSKLINTKKKVVMIHILQPELDSFSNFSSQSKSSKSNSKDRTLQRIKKKKDEFSKKHRHTFIFIAISLICIFTYSPRLILMILESLDSDFWFNFYDDSGILRFLNFLNRLHIVNNIANPFLYALFDQKFKRHLVNIIKYRKSSSE